MKRCDTPVFNIMSWLGIPETLQPTLSLEKKHVLIVAKEVTKNGLHKGPTDLSNLCCIQPVFKNHLFLHVIFLGRSYCNFEMREV